MWYPYKDGQTIGQEGSENGVILLDEEHPGGARVTLERDGNTAPFSIVCGIYQVMFHTQFFLDLASAQEKFEETKKAIEDILALMAKWDADDSISPEEAWRLLGNVLSDFVQRF